MLHCCCLILLACLCLQTIEGLTESQLFPFGKAAGDSSEPPNDDSFQNTTISIGFHFFNHTYNTLWVNTNGAVSFNGGLATFTPQAFPYSNHIKMVAPFWADVDTRNNPGRIYFRETTDQSLLQQESMEINRYFPNSKIFKANWTFIVTWYNVTYFGGSENTPTNTFQCALVTDGMMSYAIFNYAKTTWTSGTASSGSGYTGLGGIPAQVGFDAGDGLTYTTVPESRTDTIVNITSMSNLNPPYPGKYIFKINEAVIIAPPTPPPTSPPPKTTATTYGPKTTTMESSSGVPTGSYAQSLSTTAQSTITQPLPSSAHYSAFTISSAGQTVLAPGPTGVSGTTLKSSVETTSSNSLTNSQWSSTTHANPVSPVLFPTKSPPTRSPEKPGSTVWKTCTLADDLHFTTFDGYRYYGYHQADCPEDISLATRGPLDQYQSNVVPYWEVYLLTEDASNSRETRLRNLFITVEGRKFMFSPHGLYLDYENIHDRSIPLPWNMTTSANKILTVRKEGGFKAVIQLEDLLTVCYEINPKNGHVSKISISLNWNIYNDNVEGLCGNMDASQMDDPGCPASEKKHNSRSSHLRDCDWCPHQSIVRKLLHKIKSKVEHLVDRLTDG